MKGFFQQSDLMTRTSLPLVAACGKCQLFQGCETPKMAVSGEGREGILIVGEHPGIHDDKKGVQFSGNDGRKLRETLKRHGIDMRRDCWLTNATICRSKKTPKKAVDHCRPNVVRTIERLKPKTILLLGSAAIKSVIGWVWKDSVGAINQWVGWQIPCQKLNAWICPTWHPNWIVQSEASNRPDVTPMFFDRHVAAMTRLKGRPWETVPDFRKQVRVELNDRRAAEVIRSFIGKERPIAFDLETQTLKPDGKLARIVCCSVSDGMTTIAYPWQSDAIKASKELFESDVPKIGANAKFEIRYLLRNGIRVRNWKWDCVVGAHVLDCRRGITSVKFQAFVLLGQSAYNEAIEPWLRSKDDNGNSPNRIREIGVEKLLVYCALDSVLEWHLAMKQSERAGIEIS